MAPAGSRLVLLRRSPSCRQTGVLPRRQLAVGRWERRRPRAPFAWQLRVVSPWQVGGRKISAHPPWSSISTPAKANSPAPVGGGPWSRKAQQSEPDGKAPPRVPGLAGCSCEFVSDACQCHFCDRGSFISRFAMDCSRGLSPRSLALRCPHRTAARQSPWA